MDGTITIGAKIETKQFDRQIEEMERTIADLESQLKLEGTGILNEKEIHDVQVELEKAKNKLAGLYQQKAKMDASGGFKNLNKSLQDATRKVSRLVLGIFGIRSAYMAVRRASSDLASYDQQYATNLEYIRFVLTQAIAPALQWIVRLAGTLLSYLNAILSTWFGINLFGNATAEKFASMKKNAGGVAKSAKEIRKQLAGFDEMNILGDNTASSGGGGGAGDVPMPDLNFNQPLPKWMEDLLKYKDLIISAILGIAGAIWAIHSGATALQAIGLGLLIGGIVYAIEGIIGYINDPSWANFGQIIEGIGVAVIGLGMVIGSLPAVIGGAIALIVGLVVQNWETIKAFLENGLNWLKDKIDWVGENFGIVGKFIYETFIDLLEGILKIFDNLFVSIKGIFDGIITFVKAVFTGNWKQAWEGIKQIFTNIWNIMFGTFKTITDTIASIVLNFWTMLKNGASLAWEGIKYVFSSVATFFRNTFETAWTAVKNVFSTGGRIFDGIKEGIVTAFKSIVNAIITGINKVVSVPFNAINNVLNKIRNIDIVGQKPFSFISTISVPQIPLLKTGGIVSMPNKGVPVGALAGESGREGVIPLTDAQAMEELGRAIGRYINLNATIPVYVGNRQIAREIKRIDAEDDFAYNR